MEKIEVQIYAWSEADGYIVITEDVISPLKYKYGIFGIGPTDRIANVGTCKFTLNNSTRKYTPDYSVEHGWGKNTIIYIEVLYQSGLDYYQAVVWAGKIEKLTLKDNIGDIPTVEITAVDGMNELVNYPLPVQEMLYNRTLFTAGSVIFNQIPSVDNWVWDYSLDKTGKNFPTVFDSGGTVSAYSEFNKMVLSELGYMYFGFRPNGWGIYFLENSTDRVNIDYTKYYLPITLSGKLETEIPEYLLQETGDMILLDEETYTSFVNDMVDYKITYGDNVINQVGVKVYPREVSSASTVLYHQDEPIEIPAGESKYYKVTYADPSGSKDRVAGRDMITPTPYIDYEMNQYESGSGIDYTDFLIVNTVNENHANAPYGAFGTILKVRNTWYDPCFVTLLQCRGTATYFRNPIETFVSASASIEYYGVRDETLDQKYITDVTSGEDYADLLIGREKTPRTVLKSIKFIPNTSDALMAAFIENEIGNLIHIEISDMGISSSYFIQGIEAEIGLDGLITTEWTVLENVNFSMNFFILDDPTYGLLDSGNVLAY